MGTTGVGDGVGIGVGVEVTTGVGVGVGVGAATGTVFFTATPLFHTNLFPDLMQVNFLPPTIAVAPALVHFAPALIAAKEGGVIRERDRAMTKRMRLRDMPIR